ncbi:MAG TPA: peroxiredoxin-like family protein [Sphingobium sp.]
MTHPLVAALEDEFQKVRDLDLPLAERLAAIADVVRVKAPDFAVTVDRFVARLEAASAGAAAPQIGDHMPSFSLPDHEGRLVHLDDLLARGPVIIGFHRGHWCPYCRLNMVGLAEIQGDVLPAQIVAISSETRKYTQMLRAESGATFPFLSDVGGGYCLSINLAIFVDEFMSSLIAGAGWDVPGYQGGTPWILPVPAVFVLDGDGVIVSRHVDPDYRRRLEPSTILKELKPLLDRS